MKNKILLFLTFVIIFLNYSIAQVVVNSTSSVNFYIQNVLLGTGVTVSNVTFNGSPGSSVNAQVGSFSDATSSVGLPAGMILATGDATLAGNTNSSGGQNAGGNAISAQDPQLSAISTNILFDQCILEFDFIPTGDTLSFNYVFASEEYPEYVCSTYNDVFGFFLSGPNPLGGSYVSKNLALVPNPSVPGTFTNTAVAINTINPGVAGSSGDVTNCSAIDPSWAAYNIYYVDHSAVPNYCYDGRTVSLPVFALVNCGSTYHIKIAIGDAGDNLFDSGVFLEAGSFSAAGGLDATTAVVPNDILLCAQPYTISVNGGPTPPPISFWDFGDGIGTSNLASTNYTYADTGTYVVTYIASDPSACVTADTAYFTVSVRENVPLDAQINIPPYNPCSPGGLTIQLDFTGAGADSIYWDMGNGDTFIDSTSFSYTYTIGGNYILSFQAWDFDCGGYSLITDTVHFSPNYTSVNATPPVDEVFCALPYLVNFNAGSTPPPNNYWNFGDGVGSSNLANPTYTYADTGSYTIMYVAIDSSTCNIADTAFFNVQLIKPAVLDAQFNIPPYNDCQTALTIQLDFTGTGADSLYWNMGNGDAFINDTSITYTYNTPGDYIVSFEAYDLQCNNSQIFNDTIHFNPTFTSVNATPPVDEVFCALPYLVNFNAGSTPPPNNYWNFGDGVGSSNLANPTYTYADTGSYTIMYVAIDSSTCNIADTAFFNVQLIKPAVLDAQFNIPPYNDCQTTLTIQLDFTGTGADSLYWDMGNGDTFINDTSITYTYNTTGDYVVSFEAYDLQCNNSQIFNDTIHFNPTFTSVNATPPADQVFCSQPYVVTFNAGSTPPPNNFWDFGDGVGTSTLTSLNYTYADTGTYNVMYVAIDSSTCNIADTAYFSVQLIKPAELNAQFNIPPYDRCQSTLNIQLDFVGTGADSLFWNMGNGTTFINDTSISYTYNTPGTYYVSFEAYDFDCNNSQIFTDTIYFNPTTTAVNTTVPPDITVCGSPLTVDFVSGTPIPPQNFWNFGDGVGTSVALNPSYNYTSPGSYTVMFVAIDSTTCNIADTAYFNVNLAQAPDLNVNIAFTPPLPCETANYKVNLAAVGTGADSIYWNMGNGVEFIDSTSISYEYLTAGTYNISVSLYNFFCNRIITETKVAEFVDPKESSGIIPNVFTPNGDSWNDELVFVGVDHTQDYSIKIFDRWGRKAFESTDATKNWDGKDASEGTYFYELRYTDVCSTQEKLVTGTVSLLRGPKKE